MRADGAGDGVDGMMGEADVGVEVGTLREGARAVRASVVLALVVDGGTVGVEVEALHEGGCA